MIWFILVSLASVTITLVGVFFTMAMVARQGKGPEKTEARDRYERLAIYCSLVRRGIEPEEALDRAWGCWGEFNREERTLDEEFRRAEARMAAHAGGALWWATSTFSRS